MVYTSINSVINGSFIIITYIYTYSGTVSTSPRGDNYKGEERKVGVGVVVEREGRGQEKRE